MKGKIYRRLWILFAVIALMVTALPASFADEVGAGEDGTASGAFAFVAIDSDGIIFAPEFIKYEEGDTIKDALSKSNHSFVGLEEGWIYSIDGHQDNYVRFYDEEKYDLDAAASDVTAFVLTVHDEMYSQEYLTFVDFLAQHDNLPEAEQNFTEVKRAYTSALKELPRAKDTKIAELTRALQDAYISYESWASSAKGTVNFSISKDSLLVKDIKITVTDQYGTVTTNEEGHIAMQLLSGTYSFRINRGRDEITGTFTLEEGEEKTITAALPDGELFGELSFFGARGGVNPLRSEESENGNVHTLYLPDSIITPYINLQAGTGVSSTSTYSAYAEYFGAYNGKYYGEEVSGNRITWNSQAKTLVEAASYGLEGNTIRLKVVHEDSNGYTISQFKTLEIVRIPTIKSMVMKDAAGTILPISFSTTQHEYSVKTISDSVTLDARTLQTVTGKGTYGTYEQGYRILVNGKEIAQGETVTIDVPAEGKDVTVAATATNGQSDSYTIHIEKSESIPVTVEKAAGVSVTLKSSTGSVIEPSSQDDHSATFYVTPGTAEDAVTYSWISTIDTYYHAMADFAVKDGGVTVQAVAPVREQLLSALQFKSGTGTSALIYDVLEGDFNYEQHAYTVVVPDTFGGFTITAKLPSKDITLTRSAYTRTDGDVASAYTKTNTTSNFNISNGYFVETGAINNQSTISVSHKVDGITYYQDYEISTARSGSVGGLTITDEDGNDVLLMHGEESGFSDLVYEYSVQVPQYVETLNVSFDFVGTDTYDRSGYYNVTVGGEVFERPEMGGSVETTISLDSSKMEESFTVKSEPVGEGNLTKEYVFKVVKVAPVKVNFQVTPAEANLYVVLDASGTKVSPDTDGTYTLMKGTAYTYTSTAVGYKSSSKSFVPEENMTIKIGLEAAATNPTINTGLTAAWPYFRYDLNNNGAVDYPIPTSGDELTLYWANKLGSGYGTGATGNPILVGDYLYTYAGSSILKIDTMTGAVVASGEMVANSAFAINSPAYANGVIYVGINGGRVQAFNAETLESLWVYTDPLGGQPNSQIVVYGGYVYTGFWNSEVKKANFVCLTETDEDPSQTLEDKAATWTYTGNGFYWSGAYVGTGAGDTIKIIVGSDDGKLGSTDAYGVLLSLDPVSGSVIDSIGDTFLGDIRSSVTYDEETQMFYFTSKGGYFCRVAVDESGKFISSATKAISLKTEMSGADGVPASTSTPVIYNGRAYVGVSGTSTFGNNSGHNITVIDVVSMQVAYAARTQGYVQTSGLLSTAYSESDGYTYVYFIENATPSTIRVLRDRPGQYYADYMSDQDGVDMVYSIFTPYGNQAQYGISSPIADEYGNMYFKNDSAYMMKVGPTIEKIEVVQDPNNLTYMVGDTFDGAGMKVVASYSNGVQRDITDYVAYTTEPLTEDDFEITITFDLGENMLMYGNDAAGGSAGTEYVPPQTSVDITISGELDSVKTAAKEKVAGYADEADYRDAEKAEIASIIEQANAAIDGADTSRAVNDAVNEALSAIDALKTDADYRADEDAAALAQAKEEAKTALASYVDLSAYRDKQQGEIADILADASNAIDAATSAEEIAEAVAFAEAALDAVKTDEQLAIEDAKAAAKAEIESYVDPANYRVPQQEEIASIIATAEAEVEKATTADEMAATVATAKAELDTVKTDAQLTEEEEAAELDRIVGANRYETAFLTADRLKAVLGLEAFDGAVIASGTGFADALAGAYLADTMNAPILLVGPGKVTDVANYVAANVVPGGRIYILGGTGAVSADMDAALAGYDVVRLAGANRYETNIEILKAAGVTGGEIAVANGLVYADALSVSAVGVPVLLVGPDLYANQLAYLETLENVSFTAIGGEGAVNATVYGKLGTLGATDRIAGVDRYATSVAVAERYFGEGIQRKIVLTYGQNYPDGLCGGVLASKMNAPILLVVNAKYDDAMAYARAHGSSKVTILGGETLISTQVALNIVQ